MVQAVVPGVRIAGIQAAIPQRSHSLLTDDSPFDADEVRKLADATGVVARRIAPPGFCASDLCLAAAESLLARLDWDPASIGVLILVTQHGDYVIPATACILQRRLGLSSECAAFDINLGCSGYAYGLWTAAQLLRGSNKRRALVLAGDISTSKLRPDDRASVPLFGDAGSATAIELDDAAEPMHAVLGTDGSGASHLIIKAGGARRPLLPTGRPRTAEEEAELYQAARLHLNGAEVFTFTLRVVPKLIAEILALAGLSVEEVDAFVFHQANRFMLDHLAKRSKLPAERVVIDLENYGNTSSASIPLAICSALAEAVSQKPMKLLLAGFGVGWSWGALMVRTTPPLVTGLTEVPDDFPLLQVG